MHGFRSKPQATGRSRSRYLAELFGRELRLARVSGGLSQARVARLAGLSQTTVSRAERGDVQITLEARAILAAATGHELGWRLYPTSTISLRDSGQLTIATAIISGLHASWRPALEVGVAPGDPRAADILLTHDEELAEIEIERGLFDFQAQLRIAQRKRDTFAANAGRTVRLILAVPDGHRSRAILAAWREVIATALPVASKHTWTSLRTGKAIGGDGILFVRVRERRTRGDARSCSGLVGHGP